MPVSDSAAGQQKIAQGDTHADTTGEDQPVLQIVQRRYGVDLGVEERE